MDRLTRVLVALEDGRQRATYGAVADFLGVPAMFLMRGRPRDPLHSWIVNRKTLLPTGYLEDAMHPDLLSVERVLTSQDDLATYLPSST